jgi:hypothetical protein
MQMKDPITEPQNQNLEQHLTGFAHDIRAWVQKELELAKAEFSQKLRATKRNLIFVVFGWFLVQCGVIALVAAGVVGLAHFMPLGWALVLAGGVVILVGGLSIGTAFRNISNQTILPVQTIKALKTNKDNSAQTDEAPE